MPTLYHVTMTLERTDGETVRTEIQVRAADPIAAILLAHAQWVEDNRQPRIIAVSATPTI